MVKHWSWKDAYSVKIIVCKETYTNTYLADRDRLFEVEREHAGKALAAIESTLDWEKTTWIVNFINRNQFRSYSEVIWNKSPCLKTSGTHFQFIFRFLSWKVYPMIKKTCHEHKSWTKKKVKINSFCKSEHQNCKSRRRKKKLSLAKIPCFSTQNLFEQNLIPYLGMTGPARDRALTRRLAAGHRIKFGMVFN